MFEACFAFMPRKDFMLVASPQPTTYCLQLLAPSNRG